MIRQLTLATVLALASLASVTSLAACSKSDSSSGSASSDNAEPPAKPFTGAPAAFVVDKIEPTALETRVYNFSDKKVAGWGVLMRYYDDKGNVLKVKVGTPFEKDFDFWSMSGKRYTAEPKAWASIKIDHLEVPKGAVKAEVLANRMTALAADGNSFEEEPLFSMSMMDWPTPK
ncbi:MAG: hypothetical protein KIT31_30315 [Deltaproteobacteria bacterium]|nr:hypothetical protein [Deltaproteobacteria bacterium]